MSINRLRALRDYGQSVWIDFISRDALRSGELATLVEDGVLGLTSNPAIFEKAIAASRTYDEEIARLAGAGKSVPEIYEALALADITSAAGLLRTVHDATDALDGYVSIEVSPHLAHDTAGTIAEAKRLWAALALPNIMIKVPGTPEGIPAIRALIAAGINVNVTLLFSLSAYEAAAQAHIEGLETRLAAGGEIRNVASVASFFVSRVDTAIDKLVEPSLRGKAAVANAKLAYELFQRLVAGQRWAALQAHGARPQRPLWASTSTKDPSYPDTIYVDELIGPHTVNTMPPQTVAAFRDHGSLGETVTRGLDAARADMAALAVAGVSMEEVTAELLRGGVKAFADAFDRLEGELTNKVSNLAAK